MNSTTTKRTATPSTTFWGPEHLREIAEAEMEIEFDGEDRPDDN